MQTLYQTQLGLLALVLDQEFADPLTKALIPNHGRLLSRIPGAMTGRMVAGVKIVFQQPVAENVIGIVKKQIAQQDVQRVDQVGLHRGAVQQFQGAPIGSRERVGAQRCHGPVLAHQLFTGCVEARW